MIYKIKKKESSEGIIQKAKIADNFFSRLFGLMFRKNMAENEALIFYHAASIHTFFMRFSIDLVFLDKENKIIKISKALKPWRVSFCLKSSITIELPPHKASQNSLKEGDILEIIPEA